MNNLIELYKDALSSESCDYIINCFDEFKDRTVQGAVGRGVDKTTKDSTDLDLLGIGHILEKFIFEEFKTSLKENIDKYTEKYTLYDSKHGNLWDNFHMFPNSILAKKYEKEKQGYHTWHSDFGLSSHAKLRHLVCMYYLNTVEEGGETAFINQDVQIKPEKGTLVIFPAYFTHLHKGNIPISNDKYILNFWLLMGKPKIQHGFYI